MEPGGRLPARSVGPPRPGDERTLSAAVYVQNGWTKDGRLTKKGSVAIFRKTWQNAPAAAWRGLWQLRQDALIEWRWLTESGELTQLGIAKINDGSWNNPPGAVAEQLRKLQKRAYDELAADYERRRAAHEEEARRLMPPPPAPTYLTYGIAPPDASIPREDIRGRLRDIERRYAKFEATLDDDAPPRRHVRPGAAHILAGGGPVHGIGKRPRAALAHLSNEQICRAVWGSACADAHAAPRCVPPPSPPQPHPFSGAAARVLTHVRFWFAARAACAPRSPFKGRSLLKATPSTC